MQHHSPHARPTGRSSAPTGLPPTGELQGCRRDGLTGIGCRRFFDDLLARELRPFHTQRQRDHPSPLRCGHFQALRKRHLWPSDEATNASQGRWPTPGGRRRQDIGHRSPLYGGENLSSILPDTSVGGILFVAEKLPPWLAIPHSATERGSRHDQRGHRQCRPDRGLTRPPSSTRPTVPSTALNKAAATATADPIPTLTSRPELARLVPCPERAPA